MKRYQKLLFTCLSLVGILSTIGASTSLVAQNKEKITVYTALENDQVAVYLPMFKKEFPNIDVEIVRDSTGVVTAKLLAEKSNPRADVVWGLAASSLLIAESQGMLQPFAPRGLNRVRPNFRDADKVPSWVGIDAWMSAFCVNTAELKKKNVPLPTSWADLGKPIYKGMVVMPNPASSGTGYLSVAGILQMMGETRGWQYLDKLHGNIAQYVHSGSKPCRQAANGEYAIGISFDYRAIQEKAKGGPIEAVFPKEGSGWDIEANALIKKPQVKTGAKTFLNWAITEPVMVEYAKNYPVTAIPTKTAIPAGYPANVEKQLIKNDFRWMAKNRDRILKQWTEKYDSKSVPK